MGRWLTENPTKQTLRMRKWLKTEKGLAYAKRHRDDYKRRRKENHEAYRKTAHAYSVKFQRALKIELLTHYSSGPPRCACCGEATLAFLSLDHINNDGAKDRKKGGRSLYFYLKKNGYPKGIQVLCMNCNFGKKCNGGVCPHSTVKSYN